MGSPTPAGELALPTVGKVHDRYLALDALARERLGGSLRGKLIFYEMAEQGVSTLVAANVAGAASLGVDPERERLKQAMRAGLVDFLVTDLDEALRILKNEIRKQKPVSVCLPVTAEACVAEMVERGVQPDVLAAGGRDGLAVLRERGALEIPALREDAGRAVVRWAALREAARVMPLVDALASGVLAVEEADTLARRHWVESSPRYLGRALGGEHCVRMTEKERAEFSAAVREAGLDENLTIDFDRAVRP